MIGRLALAALFFLLFAFGVAMVVHRLLGR